MKDVCIRKVGQNSDFYFISDLKKNGLGPKEKEVYMLKGACKQ